MKKGGIIGLLAIAVAVAVMISTFGDAGSYGTFEMAKGNPGVEFNVAGSFMKEMPQEYDPLVDPNHYTFFMRDSLNNEMKIIYKDAKPTDIEKSERVVVIGKAINENEFAAKKILQKCPSKYKEEELAAN
ncbi:MAG: cytochrome c maturation protein CcmE [Bacteroidia bacterium]